MSGSYRTPSKRRRHSFETLETRAMLAAHIVGDPTVYSTIQQAVNAAKPNAVINVDAGTYPELVTINQPLTLRGARAGMDGRSNVRGSGESVITGVQDPNGPNHISSIVVNASGVTVDGFTVTGNTSNGDLGAGIVIRPGQSGSTIVNNILHDNVAGLFLANNSATNAALIQHNFFYNNNLDGDHSGRGIYTNGGLSGANLTNVVIDSNAFLSNYGSKLTTSGLEAAIALETLAAGAQSNITITNNFFDDNGKAALFYNTDNVLIEGNLITWCRDMYSGAIRGEGGTTNFTIRGNTMYANPGNVVRVDNKVVPNPNSGWSVVGNNIYLDGLKTTTHTSVVVDPGQYDGVFNAANNWWGSINGPAAQIAANGNDVISTPWALTPFAHPLTNAYLQAPWATDGIIQLEYFDHGGEGVAYHDMEASNLALAKFRQPWGVDVQVTSDVDGGYNIAYVKAGEWLQYSMNIATAGVYDLDLRAASGASGGKVHFELDGQNISGTISIPNTGGYQNWRTLTVNNVTLPAGPHTLRLVMDANNVAGSVANLNWFQFRSTAPILVPAAPGNLAATAGAPPFVGLTWKDNSDNETGFIIERKSDSSAGAWQLIATTGPNAESYVDTHLAGNTSYTYRVRAVGLAGESGNSNEASATTPAADSLVYLSDLTWVSATNGWGPVERDMGNGGSGAGDGTAITLNGVVYPKGLGTHAISDIVYDLGAAYSTFLSDVGVDDRQATNGSVVFQVFADGVKVFDSGVMGANSATQSINIDVTGVQQLRLHVDDAGDGNDYDHSDWAGARLLTASRQEPILSAAAVSGTQIDLTWTDVTAATGFRIERSTDGTNFSAIGTTSAGVLAFADTTVSGGSAFYYRVIAILSDGETPPSNVVSAVPLQAPAAPSGLVAAAASSSQINVTWSDVPGETSYRIERSVDGIDFSTIGSVAAGSTTYSDTTCAASTTYFYRVVAINAIGESPASAVASATTPAGPTAPAAPSALVASALSNSRIDLAWTDNSANEASFIIERSLDGISFAPLATLGANITSYSDTTVSGYSATYYYRVRAGNAVGDSENSNIVSATTPALPPAPVAPGNLVATAISSSRIDLVWSDNATNESGYQIERSSDGVTFTQVGQVAADAVNYSDTSCAAGTKYYYRVRASNAGGDSDYSNVSAATTAAALPAGWNAADVGPVTIAGSSSYNNGVFTITGSGSDIYGSADSFQFAYRQMTGDGTIVARLNSMLNTDANAKAGIMIRDSLAANAREVSLAVTPGNGLKFLRRTPTGGSTATSTVTGIKAPTWLKLVRSGGTITAYRSSDGKTWTSVGSQSVSMNSTVYVGLALCGHNSVWANTATFDNVSIS